MTRRRRPTSPFARLLGIVLMLPGLLEVPLPQIDFHVIQHHHGAGEVCPKHDHLLRWHPQAGEGEDVAVLHWHWLLPRSGDANPEAAGRSIPALHAHDGDMDRPDPATSPLIVRETTAVESRLATGSSPGLGLDLAWFPAPITPDLAERSQRVYAGCDGLHPDALLSRLVRRNC